MQQAKFLLFAVTLIMNAYAYGNYNDQDLAFIYNTIIDSHPGIHNKLDPSFREKLDFAHAQAQQAINENIDIKEKKKILSEFTNSFHDAHLWIQWSDQIALNNKSKSQIIVTYPSKQIVWIKLPTFDFDNGMMMSFKGLLYELAKFGEKDAIIFDLRGNQGGNSEHGTEIIKALLGAEYVEYKKHVAEKNQYVEWRASEGNLEHIKSLYKKHQSKWLEQVLVGMQQSVTQNELYYREYEPGLDNFEYQAQNTAIAKIIVIIDSINVSAALDFIDDLKIVTEPVLIGRKTKGDSLYMEVRTVSLPSHMGNFSFPIKVYRNRTRANDEPYLPDIKFEDINDDCKLRNLVMSTLQRKEQ